MTKPEWTFLAGLVLGLAIATLATKYTISRQQERLLTDSQCREIIEITCGHKDKYLEDCCWARCFGEENRGNCEKFCKQGAYLDY